MDPIQGSGPKPITTTASGAGQVETPGTTRPDAMAGTPSSGVYAESGSPSAARGDWPALPDPGQGPGFGEATVDRCSSEIAKLEKELDNLGDGPEAMAKVMKLQRKLDNYTRIMMLISEIWKSQSDAIRSVISNMH
jgi:hypothetical protein